MVSSAKIEYGVRRLVESPQPSVSIEVLSSLRVADAFAVHMGVSEFVESGVPPQTLKEFQERCSGKVDIQLLLGSLNGKPAGYALGYKIENQPGYYVDLAGVRDDFRRQGVHTAMMNNLEEIAQQKGHDSIWFKTWRKREAMRSWAKTHGYKTFIIDPRKDPAKDRFFFRKIFG